MALREVREDIGESSLLDLRALDDGSLPGLFAAAANAYLLEVAQDGRVRGIRPLFDGDAIVIGGVLGAPAARDGCDIRALTAQPASGHRPGGRSPLQGLRGRTLAVTAGASTSALLCGAIALSPGAVAWWALFLTLCQAAAMVLCSRDHKVGWALGLMMQAPWVTYDIATHQYPFIATGLIVSAAQISALRRLSARERAGAAVGPTSVQAAAPLFLAEVVDPTRKRDNR